MAFFTIKDIELKGVSACVPSHKEDNKELSFFSSEERDKLIASTGIESRRVSTNDVCTSDLCLKAADQLIEDLNWHKNEIDVLIFVTQTPDYVLPATSCILQDRLGLSESCYTLDISLGCSGWVHGMSVAASLLSVSHMKNGRSKGLILTGDTISKLCSIEDKSTYLLFGDAGTATALELNAGKGGFLFHVETDGNGFETIIVPDGGYRNATTANSLEKQFLNGNRKNKLNLHLEGMDVFTFGITKAPESVNKLINEYQLDKDQIDFFTFHQANLFMNEKIRKKLKLPAEKVSYSLKDFGNTSSASIPLTMVAKLSNSLKTKTYRLRFWRWTFMG